MSSNCFKKTHGLSGTRLNKIWRGIKQRCHNPKNPRFQDYGAKGIIVCDEWQSFVPFMEWAFAHGYTDDLSIDRIDNEKSYSPDNCRWATVEEQMANRSNNVRLEDGSLLKNGIPLRTFYGRVSAMKWNPLRAATTPYTGRSGWKRSAEANEKISKAHMGKTISAAHNAALQNGLKKYRESLASSKMDIN